MSNLLVFVNYEVHEIVRYFNHLKLRMLYAHRCPESPCGDGCEFYIVLRSFHQRQRLSVFFSYSFFEVEVLAVRPFSLMNVNAVISFRFSL